MEAICYTEKGVAVTKALPLPELRPGHALVRVRAAGLCHTDIDVLHGRYGEGRFPLVPCHEFAGVIEAVAGDVSGLAVGARVVVDPNLPCGQCRACRKGLTNLCRDLKAYGVTEDGGFAEYSLVRTDHLHEIGDLDFNLAALAEPLACVLNGLGSAGLRAGPAGTETALVFGAGPIGLLLALSLKAEGVSVTVADINEARLAFAERLGLETAVSGTEALASRHRSFDFVADATGIARVVEGMIDFAADGGTVLVFGVCAPDQRISIAPFEIFRRQIRFAGSHSLNRNVPQALDVLRRDTGAMAQLVSHRLPLSEVLPFITKKSADPATMKVQFSID
ncbi:MULTISPECIES: zinc-dependent alcohol dehydrogenase family protein [Rhizobium]|uniref:zinc-dependent alcohol dehydrogenase family protein n=1 Tax=Rhizobium TaxID=379 RepID=UPI0007EB5065|nr:MULTISPECIES: zinc-dependent alcohol dehydrogenase family protein [Rhizobium]ANK94004.1 Zn-dependent alcohol dehydrogenase GroES-like protein [Rhizobium sp. N6212]ANL00055.1 Zn-dependent alcohol dehydrogenase GroES-like protein [Rhizobium sp. N621]ANL06184.1 Zn-dependent alcohol dehydrogenase GroES-like protein [Rhizobium esperanzae]ANL12349.1 Zn-dependent alcohol dehydrogenase GroES-like protein [Rhizobium sp. N1341]ANM37023.1 Zn-dependent alcohol dehydrogenase GroES-like protein [Rhizobiu